MKFKINEFPNCRRFPKLFQRSAFRNDDPESFDLETVISPIWMSSWASTWRTTLRAQCPPERASIRAVGACLRAARDHLSETLPGLFQQLRVIYDSTCQGRREEGGWRVNRGEVRGYFSACQPSQPASFYFLPFFKDATSRKSILSIANNQAEACALCHYGTAWMQLIALPSRGW